MLDSLRYNSVIWRCGFYDNPQGVVWVWSFALVLAEELFKFIQLGEQRWALIQIFVRGVGVPLEVVSAYYESVTCLLLTNVQVQLGEYP